MSSTDTLKITTNNVPRAVVNAWELTLAERGEFDYIDWRAVDRGEDSASFFRFKGQLYNLGEFGRTTVPGWDGQQPDSFFSGVLVRYVENGERVIVATYYA